MGFDAATKGLVREKAGSLRPTRTVRCPRCGGTNSVVTARCRSCLTPLPREAPGPAPRTVTPTIDPRGREMDAVLGELEVLTRKDVAPAVRFQCAACGSLVAEDAVRCACGAVFEDRRDVAGYECPLCGARVSGDATVCACGARFSD